MDSLIWYTGIFRIKPGILESSQESRNPAKIPKDSESRQRKFIVSDPRMVHIQVNMFVCMKSPINEKFANREKL